MEEAPVSRHHGPGPEAWAAPVRESNASSSNSSPLSKTLVRCEGFVAERCTRGGNGEQVLLAWEERYILLDPIESTLSKWNLVRGKVYVSRPESDPDVVYAIKDIVKVSAAVGGNPNRFALHLEKQDRREDVLSFMADTPEDAKRWINAAKMTLALKETLVLAHEEKKVENLKSKVADEVLAGPLRAKADARSEVKAPVVSEFLTALSSLTANDANVCRAVLYGLPAFLGALDASGTGYVQANELQEALSSVLPSMSGFNFLEMCEALVVGSGECITGVPFVALLAKMKGIASAALGESNTEEMQNSSARESKIRRAGGSISRLLGDATLQKSKAPATSRKNGLNGGGRSAAVSSKRRGSRKGNAPKSVGAMKGKNKSKSQLSASPRSLAPPAAPSLKQVKVKIPSATRERSEGGGGNQGAGYRSVKSLPGEILRKKKLNTSVSKRSARIAPRRTSYTRPWAKSSSQSSHRLKARGHHNVKTASRSGMRQTAKQNSLKTNKSESLAAEEGKALRKALNAARKVLAAETRARIAAEKAADNVRNARKREVDMLKRDQFNREKGNASSLEKLHALYGMQIQKLQMLLRKEGKQLSEARQEICDLSISLQQAAIQGAHVDLGRRNRQTSDEKNSHDFLSGMETSMADTASYVAAEKGAADLLLLEKLASVEEELANAKDDLKILRNESAVLKPEMQKMKEENGELHSRVAKLVVMESELRQALAVSKEESSLLERERLRLMAENSKLTKAIEKMDKMVFGRLASRTKPLKSKLKSTSKKLSTSLMHPPSRMKAGQSRRKKKQRLKSTSFSVH